jgi:hypothetical protein
MVAYEGDVKRLNAISGNKPADRPAPFDLRAFAREHNAARAAKLQSE